MTEDLEQTVRDVLRRRLGATIDPVAADQKLADALAERYDSLMALECVTAVEAEFGIEVDFVTHDVRHWFSSIALMAQFVRAELEDRAALGGGR
jgi:acyl carrier protein